MHPPPRWQFHSLITDYAPLVKLTIGWLAFRLGCGR